MIQEFHDRHAGRTFESFGRGTIGDGNSYDLLARSVMELAPGSRVLDLACGDGVLLQTVADLRDDLELIGVDLNARELEVARNHGIPNASFTRARADRLPLPDADVDHVLCHMSFMLFDDPEAVVAELGRVVRPAGKVVLLVSDGTSPEGARRVFVDLVKRHEVAMPRLGTRRARTPEGLAALFSPVFDEKPVIERIELNLDGSPDQVWSGLELMYNFDPLSQAQRADVRAGFFARFDDDSVVPYRISMIRAEFVRSRDLG